MESCHHATTKKLIVKLVLKWRRNAPWHKAGNTFLQTSKQRVCISSTCKSTFLSSFFFFALSSFLILSFPFKFTYIFYFPTFLYFWLHFVHNFRSKMQPYKYPNINILVRIWFPPYPLTYLPVVCVILPEFFLPASMIKYDRRLIFNVRTLCSDLIRHIQTIALVFFVIITVFRTLYSPDFLKLLFIRVTLREFRTKPFS